MSAALGKSWLARELQRGRFSLAKRCCYCSKNMVVWILGNGVYGWFKLAELLEATVHLLVPVILAVVYVVKHNRLLVVLYYGTCKSLSYTTLSQTITKWARLLVPKQEKPGLLLWYCPLWQGKEGLCYSLQWTLDPFCAGISILWVGLK